MYIREVTGSCLVLSLFFCQEARESDNIRVDLLVAHGPSVRTIGRHDDQLLATTREIRGWKYQARRRVIAKRAADASSVNRNKYD